MADSVLWEASSLFLQPCDIQNIDGFIKLRLNYEWIATSQHTSSDKKTKEVRIVKFIPISKNPEDTLAYCLFSCSFIRAHNSSVIRHKHPAFFHGTAEDMFLKFIIIANEQGFTRMVRLTGERKKIVDTIPFLLYQFPQTCI